MKRKVIYPIVLFSLLIVIISNCKKKDDDKTPATLPVVSTDTAFNVTQTSAQSGGKIKSDGGASITARGVCWGKNSNPTILDYKTIDGDGAGSFTSSLSGLTNNTIYFIRAYATNSVGTAYGSQLSFTTGTLTDVDGNIYNYVTIGSQTWMSENLKTTRYRNGDIIPTVSDNTAFSNLTTGASDYSNNDVNNLKDYGRIYNWYAVNDNRNICPKGWHIPSDVEWMTLMTSLGGMSPAGGKMKQTGTTFWNAPNDYATNSSGFNGVGAGFRNMDGAFMHFKQSAYFWSSTSVSPTNATAWYLYYTYGDVKNGSYSKRQSYCIRCVKD